MTGEFKEKLEAWENARDEARLAESRFGLMCESVFGALDRGADADDVAWFVARAREARDARDQAAKDSKTAFDAFQAVGR